MDKFLKEILEHEVKPDNMFQDHIEGMYTIKQVPCREVEGIGIVYSSKTMNKVLKLIAYMKENALSEVEFNFSFGIAEG